MTKELFIPRQFRSEGLKLISQANAIIDEYQDQGFALTLRQLYYQFVARDLFANTQDNYKKLGRYMTWARDAGLVDWDAIEDRSRAVNTHQAWASPADIIAQDAMMYAEDLWRDQQQRPAIWIEKDSLVGVIEDVCTRWRVPYYAQRGNDSRTMKYEAGKRFADQLSQGQVPVVLFLGDHDPTGIEITRDTTRCLSLYAGQEIEVRRIALNMDQVRRYRPPQNAAKEADPNFKKYFARFGTRECWELDALSPAVIADLIDKEIKTLVKPKPWKLALAKEVANRGLLEAASEDWERIAKRLR